MRRILGLIFCLFLAGCVEAVWPPLFQADPLSDLITKGLKTASDNFHLAVKSGDLEASDPIIPCIDSIVPPDGPPAPNYVTNDLISIGSVLYIKAAKLKKSKGAADQACKALIGEFVLNGMNARAGGIGILR